MPNTIAHVEAAAKLFLASFNGVTVLARHNLNLSGGDHLVRLHLEGRVGDYKLPHLVTFIVVMIMSLNRKDNSPSVQDGTEASYFHASLALNRIHHRICQRLVELTTGGSETSQNIAQEVRT